MNQRDLQSDLDAYVEGEAWPAPDDNGEPIPPQSLDEVSRILRRLHRLEQERADVIAVAAADVSRIESWREDRTRGIEREIEWGKRSLEPFARAWVAGQRGKKVRKQLSTPDGTLKLTKPSARVVLTDVQSFLRWATGIEMEPDHDATEVIVEKVKGLFVHPDVVQVKADINVAALRKATTPGPETTAGGVVSAPLMLTEEEIVPGVELQRDAEDRFNVNLAEGIE